MKGGARLVDEKTMRWVVGTVLYSFILTMFAMAARWRLGRRDPALIPPPRRHRFVPWSGTEVALSLLLYYLIPAVLMTLLAGVGVLSQSVDMKNMAGVDLFKIMAAAALFTPLQMAAIGGLLWLRSRTKARHLGLSRWRWQAHLTLGVVCYVVVTPIVYGANYLAHWATEQTQTESSMHPIQRLVTKYPEPSAWIVVVLQAVILAPLVEELLVRGIMLPWLSRRRWGGWAAMAGGIAIGLSLLYQGPGKPLNWPPLAFALAVSLFGALYTSPHQGEQWARRAIIGTAILFAMLHATVWPTPISLLILGLALGWLAHRTRSLIAPIVMHAMFNATSMVLMLVGIPDRPIHDTTKPNQPTIQKAVELAPQRPTPPAFALRPPFPAPDGHDARNPKRWLGPNTAT